MRIRIAAALVLLGSVSAAANDGASGYRGPELSAVRPDWHAARVEAARIAGGVPSELSDEAALRQINDAMSERFAGIAESPLPVLLPLDTAAFLRERTGDHAKPLADYLGGFQPTGFFQAGPAGYDAAFSVSGRGSATPVIVEISASAFHYNLSPAKGSRELPVRNIETRFDNVRRLILENYIRYSVEKFGVTYVVAISCFDGRTRARWISCATADDIAVKFVNALAFAGGMPNKEATATAPPIERPDAVSSVFTYYPPGAILPNSGMKGEGGVADRTVYLNMRFPLKDAPAYVNSQSFMHWGDCDQTGRVPHPRGRKDFAYRCRVNHKPLVFNEGAAENYSYPWRDSFCEHRFFYVGQCPGGRGHQGVDIRPADCVHKNDRADRCQPYQDELVAVRDGMVLRAPKQEAAFLTINAPGEHVRVRYLHMHPRQLDEAGILSGRRVREGEVIGKVGNFNRRENLTTYHLHFEMMVPTRDGWVRVNPYMSLVAAYERLIVARGQELPVPVAVPLPVAAPQPEVSADKEQAKPTAVKKPVPKKRQKRSERRKRR